mmetsp:Transcript_19748/g.47137  ORF Transcript_19748/g.47137 Transcript_19748/m.47137 type:complete len:211 (+) Transcript_19748:3-635(+)
MTVPPTRVFQRIAVLSLELLAILLPSGLNTTHVIRLLCPSSGGPTGSPVTVSHRRSVWSLEPLATCRQSMLTATVVTSFEWPLIGCPRGLPETTSHRRIVRSREPLTTTRPSGLKSTHVTSNVWAAILARMAGHLWGLDSRYHSGLRPRLLRDVAKCDGTGLSKHFWSRRPGSAWNSCESNFSVRTTSSKSADLAATFKRSLRALVSTKV